MPRGADLLVSLLFIYEICITESLTKEEKEMQNNRRDTGALTLVVGATGTQGGAVARNLLSRGRVRVLVRDPEGLGARRLAADGAQLVRGDLADPGSLAPAMKGVSRVFSVQPGDPTGGDAEERFAAALVSAAVAAGVEHCVHSSVAGIEPVPDPRAPASLVKYWQKKAQIEGFVRSAGFRVWTILRPAWVMENLAEPAVRFMFLKWDEGELTTVLEPDTRLDMVCADDIAGFAAAAFDDPATFGNRTLALAAQSLTMAEVASTVSRVTGRPIASVSLSVDDALARGLHPSVVHSQFYRNLVGFQTDIPGLGAYGVPLTSLEAWARRQIRSDSLAFH